MSSSLCILPVKLHCGETNRLSCDCTVINVCTDVFTRNMQTQINGNLLIHFTWTVDITTYVVVSVFLCTFARSSGCLHELLERGPAQKRGQLVTLLHHPMYFYFKKYFAEFSVSGNQYFYLCRCSRQVCALECT